MNKKKILVVDDESGFTRLMKIALSKYEIREVNDSTKAVAAALEFQPDLILLDVIMPDLDGGDLATQIQAQSSLKNTPIIFLTAIVSPTEAGAGAQEIGGFPFLPKPVSADALQRCIEEHLRQ